MIEYQRGAHLKGLGATAPGDVVKKDGLRLTGIDYVEVVGGKMSPSELRATVEKLVLSRLR
jgi:hypothetical protein